MTGPPVLVLGVRRSGTTLLRVMLDRNSQLAVPDESYFVPQLAHRHSDPPDVTRFADDLRRLPTLREWGLSADDLAPRLTPGTSLGQAIGVVYEAYAERQGKERWGDKTPMYMEHLLLLDRLFPEAMFVHLIRDGRDAAASFLAMPAGIVTRTWATPRSAADFACQWTREVESAQRLGARVGSRRYLEVRYEKLVARPDEVLQTVTEFAGLPFEPEMLGYAGTVDLSAKPHQQSLSRPPTPGIRNWRRDLPHDDALAFEEVAGPLLGRLDYERLRPGHQQPASARARLARYRALTAAWRATSYAVQRSPLWRRRHPPLS